MIILTTSATAQELKFIPREYSADSITIIDQDTNTPVIYAALTFVKEKYYLKGNVVFSPLLVEDRFYTLKVSNGSDIVYRDMIFCTDQVISTFLINKDQFVKNVTTNEYIVI